MISFKSRNTAIRQADRITRCVNSIYPHISESKSNIFIHKQLGKVNTEKSYKLCNLMIKNSTKIDNLRFRGDFGIEGFKNIIDMLKNKHIANCYEESILAQIIGKINGIKNIYPAKIYFTRNSSGADIQLDHVVSIITDKPFLRGAKYSFKNKDAIILDPWLGITEYAGKYFTLLRTNFADMFSLMPDNNLALKMLVKTSSSIEEFNKKKKEYFKPDFFLKLHSDDLLSNQDAKILQKEFPELVIK